MAIAIKTSVAKLITSLELITITWSSPITMAINCHLRPMQSVSPQLSYAIDDLAIISLFTFFQKNSSLRMAWHLLHVWESAIRSATDPLSTIDVKKNSITLEDWSVPKWYDLKRSQTKTPREASVCHARHPPSVNTTHRGHLRCCHPSGAFLITNALPSKLRLMIMCNDNQDRVSYWYTQHARPTRCWWHNNTWCYVSHGHDEMSW